MKRLKSISYDLLIGFREEFIHITCWQSFYAEPEYRHPEKLKQAIQIVIDEGPKGTIRLQ